MPTDEPGTATCRQTPRLLAKMKTAHVVFSKWYNHEHRNLQALDNNVRLTKECPQELCQAMLETLRLERGDGVGSDRSGDSGGAEVWTRMICTRKWDNWTPQWFDDCAGHPLHLVKVRVGRARECEKFTQREVYEPLLRTKAMESTDAKFIRTKWVDTQKGEGVRCCFVGQGLAVGDPRTDLFASAPPLFLAWTVVSMAAWERARPWLDVSFCFLVRQGPSRDLHRAPLRRSADRRKEVCWSLNRWPCAGHLAHHNSGKGNCGAQCQRFLIQR